MDHPEVFHFALIGADHGEVSAVGRPVDVGGFPFLPVLFLFNVGFAICVAIGIVFYSIFCQLGFDDRAVIFILQGLAVVGRIHVPQVLHFRVHDPFPVGRDGGPGGTGLGLLVVLAFCQLVSNDVVLEIVGLFLLGRGSTFFCRVFLLYFPCALHFEGDDVILPQEFQVLDAQMLCIERISHSAGDGGRQPVVIEHRLACTFHRIDDIPFFSGGCFIHIPEACGVLQPVRIHGCGEEHFFESLWREFRSEPVVGFFSDRLCRC